MAKNEQGQQIPEPIEDLAHDIDVFNAWIVQKYGLGNIGVVWVGGFPGPLSGHMGFGTTHPDVTTPEATEALRQAFIKITLMLSGENNGGGSFTTEGGPDGRA